MNNQQRVRRTAEWVEREYGREKWPAVLEMVRQAIAAEQPEAGLSRVLAQVNQAISKSEPSDSSSNEVVIRGSRVDAPRALALAAHQFVVVEAVLSACRAETDLIVELGSGWGRNLFALWLAAAPRRVAYVGAEYTAVGRLAADTLAALAPDMRFESRAFDFNKPALDSMPSARHAISFTVHAIEQIPHVGAGLTSFIAGLAHEVDCVHLEPVGWQLDSAEPTWSSRRYAEQNDYNRDLVPVLLAAQNRDQIRIVRVEPDAIGVRPANATTLIHWRSHGVPIPDPS
jgi:hypothetical protein